LNVLPTPVAEYLCAGGTYLTFAADSDQPLPADPLLLMWYFISSMIFFYIHHKKIRIN